MNFGRVALAAFTGLAVGGLGGAWIASTRAMTPIPTLNSDADVTQDDRTGSNGLTKDNPLGQGPDTVAAGKQLFTQMNCAGCHGYDGSGGMGPKLTDTYWRYGGSPGAIYTTIRRGRPQGMPAWGGLLPPQKIWQLSAYVGSLGGGVPAAQALAGLHGDFSSTSGNKPQNNAAEGGNALEGQ